MKKFWVVLFFLVSWPAMAGTAGDYLSNFYRIPAAAVGEVFTTDPDKLKRNGLAVGAVALVYTQDEAIRDFWMDNVSSDRVDRASEGFFYDIGSSTGGLMIHGALGLSALALDDQYLMDTTLLSFQAVALSQLFSEGAKAATGRERPRDSDGDSNLWGEGGMSFFSGHASGSFAALTVFAERYRHQPMVTWGAYTLASTISISRIGADAHWASDVLAGALVGYGVAHLTLRYSPFDNTGATVLPVFGEDYTGLVIIKPF